MFETVVVLGGAALLASCAPVVEETSFEVLHLVASPDAEGSTASIHRARLSDESRYVLPTGVGVPLLENRKMELPNEEDFELEVAIPEELQSTRELVIEASMHGGLDLYESFHAEPIHLRNADGELLETYTIDLRLPEPFQGVSAAVSVVAYALESSTRTEFDTPEVAVPDAAELRFGYAVASGAWAPGWAPARFRVWARSDRTEPRLLVERRIDPSRNAHDRRWFDARIDLEALAGQRVSFRFEVEAEADAPDVRIPRSLPLIANPELRPVERRARASSAPNVVLISLDTLRAQSVSTYGYERDTMPAFTRGFAADGAVVEQAVTPFPQTTASHMSMFTGLEPCAHGVLDEKSRLGAGALTMAERFRAAGYRTAAFTEDLAIADGLGYERGYDRYKEHPPKHRFGAALETFDAARQWIAEPSSQPFLAFVHTYEVHGPYTPPRGYEGFFEEESEDEWPQNRLRYDQEIRYTDDLLDDFLSELDALGLRDDTLVVVTADHGEEFMEHGFWGHGYALFDEAILVPMVLRFPGRIPAGTRIGTEVGLIDLAPTILDLVGLPPLPDVQGRSFARLLTGEGPPFDERPVYSFDRKDHHAVRTSKYKYYERGKQELLYELEKDPLEKRNVARRKPELLGEGRNALAKARAACLAWQEAHPDALPTPVDAETRAELVGKLRALGYLAQ